ncbi:MAG: dihydrofolate reductase [Clostridia bacterium]|nr:dihydrofolate reductase [Clostridia bacterium]
MDAVVAYYQNWGIGFKGTQPIVIPEDRKHFQELTEGGTVIVGRRTLADFPNGKPLKNRKTIVMTHQNIEIEGAVVAHSAEEVIEMVKDQPKVFVIGGASVYDALLPFCEKVYITKIYARPECDVFFKNLDENFEWSFESESELMTSSAGLNYRYYVYEKYYINNMIKKIK